ncbi:hypothetical protein WEI85_21190 [Actinomycetes bacterium KLBMP 9797]
MTFVLVLAAAAPGYADAGWVSPTCAIGEITSHHVERDADGDVTIRLDGWSKWCQPTQLSRPNEQFGLGLYTDNGAWLGRLTSYNHGAGTTPTPFTYVVDDTASTPLLGGPLRALCIAYAPDQRMACVSVARLSSAQPPTIQALAPNDPRVLRPIDGECPSCLK